MTPSVNSSTIDRAAAEAGSWDVVVVGSGMGGGTVAWELTRRGLNVLLIEKGHADLSKARGVPATVTIDDADDRYQEGRWPTKVSTRIDGKDSDVWAPLGCGLGGTSNLYAAALGRLEPIDFDEQTLPSGRTTRWPFSYKELEPFYEQAETLYGVGGSPDPLSSQSPWPLADAPDKAEVDDHFFQAFEAAGMHPYNLHIGVKYSAANCVGCPGFVCKENCKQSSVISCIDPAAQSGLLKILDRAEILTVNANAEAVESVSVKQDDETFDISAGIFVVSAGGYFTPALLQRSKNEHWPSGVGNTHDQVGRNLMFHISENIAIWPRGKFSNAGPRKTIALRDFYEKNGRKYGEFQSVGIEADHYSVLYYLRTILDKTWLRHIPGMRHALRIPAYAGAWIYKNATVFACILEDFPYPENRIVYDEKAASGLRVEYTIHDELLSRVKEFRRLIRTKMKSHRMFPMTASIWLNYGHPCGSCRSGEKPEESVVDAECRVHGIENLYIADSSFMPTSGGSNPSLTIAANALRVGDIIARKLGKS